MFIALESLLNGGIDEIEVDSSFDFSKEEIDGVFPFTTPVKLKGKIVNKAGIVTISATADFIFEAYCNRCAAKAKKSYSVPIEHTLVSQLNNENDSDEYIVVENMKLDIERLTLEDIYLFLPSKFLCKETCKGVCPKCGTNLNESSCDCKKDIDPRFEALLSMLDE